MSEPAPLTPLKPLAGLRVLDLSRVLAGPWAGQTLADLGAEVVKVERPGSGDDTRHWGPPYLANDQGHPTTESAYFLAANRGKKSVAVDMAHPKGAALLQQLAAKADVVLENFKVGGLKKYGLDYDSLKAMNPALVYCSITGFGQTGPWAHRPGYDAMIQAVGGLMSITGEPEATDEGHTAGGPQKVGVAVADLFTGLYAVIGIQAALAQRQQTGLGQHVDMALLDVQVAMLGNQALNYLVSGTSPSRMGNAHPNIVPYQVFATANGHLSLAVGNDGQFTALCKVLGTEALATDPRFATNQQRVSHRAELIPLLEEAFAKQPTAHWLEGLEAAGVPVAPIQSVEEVFAHPQVQHRQMALSMPHPTAGSAPGVASPIKFAGQPQALPTAPPTLGQHTSQVLADWLQLPAGDIAALKEQGVIA